MTPHFDMTSRFVMTFLYKCTLRAGQIYYIAIVDLVFLLGIVQIVYY
jgi:hypothetical protein